MGAGDKEEAVEGGQYCISSSPSLPLIAFARWVVIVVASGLLSRIRLWWAEVGMVVTALETKTLAWDEVEAGGGGSVVEGPDAREAKWLTET